jgi:hypothetical protein
MRRFPGVGPQTARSASRFGHIVFAAAATAGER